MMLFEVSDCSAGNGLCFAMRVKLFWQKRLMLNALLVDCCDDEYDRG